MPVTFPLESRDWWGALPIGSLTFDPVEQVVGDMTGKGEWITDDVAPMLWQGEVTLARMTAAEAAHAAAFMDLIRPAGRLFWAYDIRRPAPLADPRGLILGAAAPVIHELPAGGREIALSGLPARYVLSRGDYLRFARDGGRYALHRVAEARVVAGDDGTTPAFELSTMIQPGAVTGAPVALVRAAVPCMRVPGSIIPGQTRAAITEGMTMKFIQTMAVIA